VPDNVSLLSLAALLLCRLDELAERTCHDPFEQQKMREELVELQSTWRLLMSELEQQHQDSQELQSASV